MTNLVSLQGISIQVYPAFDHKVTYQPASNIYASIKCWDSPHFVPQHQVSHLFLTCLVTYFDNQGEIAHRVQLFFTQMSPNHRYPLIKLVHRYLRLFPQSFPLCSHPPKLLWSGFICLAMHLSQSGRYWYHEILQMNWRDVNCLRFVQAVE